MPLAVSAHLRARAAVLGRHVPKTAASRRALEAQEPQVHESGRNVMVLRGPSQSQVTQELRGDLAKLFAPNVTRLGRKNEIQPFENDTSLSFLSKKNDCSAFVIDSHNKKRPHNLVIGRMFDYQLLDMVEFGVTDFIEADRFVGDHGSLGAKPCIVFQGSEWTSTPELERTRSLLLDLFRGVVVDSVNLSGMDRVYVFSLLNDKILFRHYRPHLRKSGLRTPLVDLQELGPRFSLQVRRTRLASDDAWKQAMRKPRQAKARKEKNIEFAELGDRVGRVHMLKQDLTSIALAKRKGLKRPRSDSAATPSASAGKAGKRSKKQ